MLVLQERHPCTFLHALCHYSCVAYILRIVVRFARHDAFYLWQVWWSAQAGRKGRHELCSSQPYKPPTNHPARPLMQKFFRCAGQRLQRLAAHDILHGGRRAEKGGRLERKVQKHAARRGGSGNQGAVAQFSTGRRCGNWQCCTGDWAAVAFAAAPLFKRGVA